MCSMCSITLIETRWTRLQIFVLLVSEIKYIHIYIYEVDKVGGSNMYRWQKRLTDTCVILKIKLPSDVNHGDFQAGCGKALCNCITNTHFLFIVFRHAFVTVTTE